MKLKFYKILSYRIIVKYGFKHESVTAGPRTGRTSVEVGRDHFRIPLELRDQFKITFWLTLLAILFN